MKNEQQQLEALQDIRKMMKESSRFLSLSGLSGVFAGVYALAGAFIGHRFISQYLAEIHGDSLYNSDVYSDHVPRSALQAKLLIICLTVLTLSITTAFLMSARKAQKLNQRMFDHSSKKLLWSMAVPLAAGGIFCIALLINNNILMISPVMLLFYGLALLSGSKHTLSDIKYLGYFEVVLGLASAFYTVYGLLFWSLGFGVLHIVYGTIMWFKYDRS